MDLIGKKVRHTAFGAGTILALNSTGITVQFLAKECKFLYPGAFEDFLTAEDAAVQASIQNELNALKTAKREKNEAEAAARKEEEDRKLALVHKPTPRPKNIDMMFGSDYHAKHLARTPILTYQEVQEKFGIKVSGFGRGINSTSSAIILISVITKAKQSFVYHERWTEEGDYLYTGEGKTGDQLLTKGNLAIADAAKDGKTIHLFVKFSPQEYYYQGVFEVADYTYEDEKDAAGTVRKEYKFRLRKVK